MNEKPIRVLQVIGQMNRGGAETMIMNLYRHIDREQVQFDFLVHTKELGLYDDEIRSLGGNIYYVDRFSGKNAVKYYSQCRSFFAQHPEIKVVHGHIGSSAALYLKAAQKEGKYTVAHSHSAFVKINSFKDWLEDKAFRFVSYPTRYIADQLFGCSTEAGESRFGKRMLKNSKYRNFPNAIALQSFAVNQESRQKIRAELGIREDDVVIGTVGRVTKPKNPEFIYKVFKTCVSSAPDVKCVWVGYGDMSDRILELRRSDGLEDRIIMTGDRSDIPELLQAFDAFLFPSLWEGLPVTVIEAQAAGLNCLLSDKISKEVALTDQVHWKSLDESAEEWAAQCLDLAKEGKENRRSPEEQLRASGYDIDDSAKKLAQFYCANAK